MIKKIIDAIRRRISVRTFDGSPLSQKQKAELEEFIATAGSPFGGNATIQLVDADLKGPYRPGTYGVIRGARNYLLMGMASDETSMLSAGFIMEQVVLKATEMGLGTCWIAATFKGSDFARLADMPPDRPLRIISPIGVAAEKRSLLERLTRSIARSSSRKPFGDLFFAGNFSTPLPADSQWAEPLEMMRLAPSSTNSQPWRAIVTDNAIHFYYRPSHYAILDLGIGLSHFALTASLRHLPGSWHHLPTAPPAPSTLRYLISYIPNN